MEAIKQEDTSMHPREHCPPDVEPAVYVRTTDGGMIPLVLADARTGAYWAWMFGSITQTGCSAAVVRRLLAEGKAVRAADVVEVQP